MLNGWRFLGKMDINSRIIFTSDKKTKEIKDRNGFRFGTSGTGRNFLLKRQMMIAELENYIVDNHINNNNWLKQHGKPMVRKGHTYYGLARRLKKEKPMKIVMIEPEKEYKVLQTQLGKPSTRQERMNFLNIN